MFNTLAVLSALIALLPVISCEKKEGVCFCIVVRLKKQNFVVTHCIPMIPLIT